MKLVTPAAQSKLVKALILGGITAVASVVMDTRVSKTDSQPEPHLVSKI